MVSVDMKVCLNENVYQTCGIDTSKDISVVINLHEDDIEIESLRQEISNSFRRTKYKHTFRTIAWRIVSFRTRCIKEVRTDLDLKTEVDTYLRSNDSNSSSTSTTTAVPVPVPQQLHLRVIFFEEETVEVQSRDGSNRNENNNSNNNNNNNNNSSSIGNNMNSHRIPGTERERDDEKYCWTTSVFVLESQYDTEENSWEWEVLVSPVVWQFDGVALDEYMLPQLIADLSKMITKKNVAYPARRRIRADDEHDCIWKWVPGIANARDGAIILLNQESKFQDYKKELLDRDFPTALAIVFLNAVPFGQSEQREIDVEIHTHTDVEDDESSPSRSPSPNTDNFGTVSCSNCKTNACEATSKWEPIYFCTFDDCKVLNVFFCDQCGRNAHKYFKSHKFDVRMAYIKQLSDSLQLMSMKEDNSHDNSNCNSKYAKIGDKEKQLEKKSKVNSVKSILQGLNIGVHGTAMVVQGVINPMILETAAVTVRQFAAGSLFGAGAFLFVEIICYAILLRRKRISLKEFRKRVVKGLGRSTACLVGGFAGAALGSTICPGIGTIVGGVLGCIIGSAVSGVAMNYWCPNVNLDDMTAEEQSAMLLREALVFFSFSENDTAQPQIFNKHSVGRRYRRLAFKMHPDRNGSNTLFHTLNAHYGILLGKLVEDEIEAEAAVEESGNNNSNHITMLS